MMVKYLVINLELHIESNLGLAKELIRVLQMAPLMVLMMIFLWVYKWKLYLGLIQVMDLTF